MGALPLAQWQGGRWLQCYPVNGESQSATDSGSGPSTARSSAFSSDLEECPICLMPRDDVTPVEHLGVTVGDTSSHRMCASCHAGWRQKVCPFCKEVTTAAELLGFLADFLATVTSSAGDPNRSAAVLESIQLFEMEHEGQPAVIKRVYKMLAEDSSLAARLEQALKKREEWPRDMAGVFWRLDAAAQAGELPGLAETARKRLTRLVEERVWAPFEGGGGVHDLAPHFYGVLYTQALVAWLCAWRSGMAIESLAEGVRRCGRALVRWKGHTKAHKHDWRRVRERVHT